LANIPSTYSLQVAACRQFLQWLAKHLNTFFQNTPYTVSLQGLSYSVVNHNKKETLHLLRGVTGYFKSGHMAALVRSQRKLELHSLATVYHQGSSTLSSATHNVDDRN
jgi:hypothetical protein